METETLTPLLPRRFMDHGLPSILFAILEDRVGVELLARVELYRYNAKPDLGQFLYDYDDEGLGSVAALARARSCRPLPLWARANSEDGGVSPGGAGHSTRREVAENTPETEALLNDLIDQWIDFSHVVCGHCDPTTPIGMLIMYGGSAVLPLADKLVSGGFKLQLDAEAGEPLLASVVHHFVLRCWVEKQLRVQNSKAIDAFRHVLSWLSDKSADNLQINWHSS